TADRDDLFPRRPRTARLRKRAQPRLSGGVRHAVHLRAARPRGEPDLRPHLHDGRSAHRFRNAGSVSMDARSELKSPETRVALPVGPAAPPRTRRIVLSPINRRRWRNFKANDRGFYSLIIFLILFVLSLFAELIANDKPLLIKQDGHYYFPAFITYSEKT